jgi:Spy/CpxP family protein refolding chaperone
MNTLRKNVLIALTVLGMGSAAAAVQAQTATSEGRHANAATQQERMAKWGEHFAKRQAKLHDALQLNGGQESAWAAYQASIKPKAGMMGMHGDRAAWAAMPAPARMEKMIAMSKQRTAMMESRLGALNTFYSVLSPAQKKVFDENTRGGGHHGHHRGGHMKDGMQK